MLVMSTKTKTKQNSNGIVNLPAELTIQKDLNEIKDSIVKVLNENKEITMVSEKPVEVDIAFIQILQATKNKANENNKTVKINFKLSERSEKLMKICGFYNLFENI